MAIRIHVTCVRDCPTVEVRAVMSEVIRVSCAGAECPPVGDILEVQEHGGWTWFTTSVWGVSSDDLNRGLCRLARPALQFTTSDGDRWYLTVHGGPRGPVHFLHEFSYHGFDPSPDGDLEVQARLETPEQPSPIDPRLAFLEDDPPPPPDRPKAPFDLAADALNELGAHIPDAFRAAVAHLPYSAALSRYRAWHAEQVSNALNDAGISHDPPAVRSVLLWESVSEGESGSDLGNLPRLLSVLGLGGQWDDWVRQAEALPEPDAEREDETFEPEVEEQSAPAPEPEDHFGPVLAIVEPLGLTPVARGSFALPLADLTLVRFFVEALSIHNTASLVMTGTLPPGFDRSRVSPTAGQGFVSFERTEAGFRLAVENHLWFNRSDLSSQLGEWFVELVDHLPDGSTIDLASALPDSSPAASHLCQRYRGRVVEGRWQLEETFPPLSREALAGGIDLARYAAGDPESHELRDEAEAEAVIRVAKRDPRMWDLRVVRDGRTLRCEADVVGHLVHAIFRHRFAPGSWDVAGHDREAARMSEERLDSQRKMRRAGAEAARRRAAPHDDEVLYRGSLGPYWRSDFDRLEALEQETRERIDSALDGLGFSHVGDLVAKKQRDIVLRTHASGDRLSLGSLAAKRTMYLGLEFHSRFADGSILITTTNVTVNSRPLLKFYAKGGYGLEPAALYEKHLRSIARFRSRKGTEPVTLDATLEGVARECDRALARRNAEALAIRIVAVPPGEAPAEVRAAWVGRTLPLFATTDDPRVGQHAKGVVSGRGADRPEGFAVRVEAALGVLERHHPEAARWWRDHTPHLVKPGQLFVYPGEVCELVEDEAPG